MTDLIQRLHLLEQDQPNNSQRRTISEAADALKANAALIASLQENVRLTRERDESYAHAYRLIEERDRLQRERDECLKHCNDDEGYEAMKAERDRLRAALTDLEDEVRILLRDNDVEVTEGMSCAIDIASEALKGEKHD